MAKQINARIVQKHDSLENWKKATGFKPEKGEFFLVDDYDYPVIVGDGVTPASELCLTPMIDKISYASIGNLFSIPTTIDGVWIFNETPVWDKKFEYNINFMCNNHSYTSMLYQPGGLSYHSSDSGINNHLAWIWGEWSSNGKIIDFGSTPQEADLEFVAFMQYNAVKQ